MIEYFLKLYQYNAWANRIIIDAVEKMDEPTAKMVHLLGHISGAQEVWLARILHTDHQDIVIFPDAGLEDVAEKLMESSEEWIEFIETMNEDHFKEEHLYKNSKGKLFQSTLEDVIIHVINHSTYHRAQVNQLIREAGSEPAVTDYIIYSRKER